jgi:hypothetical protein
LVQNVQDNQYRLQNEQIYDKKLSHNKLIINKMQNFQELTFILVKFYLQFINLKELSNRFLYHLLFIFFNSKKECIKFV